MNLEHLISSRMASAFRKAGYDDAFAAVKASDRPDLSDFQCNGALALARQEKKPPVAIANAIMEHLRFDEAFAEISVDGPGFINLRLADKFIAELVDLVAIDARFGAEAACEGEAKTMVLDFGGPNVAKALHVGHLRSGVIGESVQRLLRFAGHKVISDVHFGDWGTPIGMIIAGIQKQSKPWQELDVAEITAIYKVENALCKEDAAAQENARRITAAFQSGDPELRAIWKHIRDVSVEDVKKNYAALDVNFDLWLGESDAHEDSFKVMEIAAEKGLLETDDGAEIIRLEQSNKPKPPVILRKSDGGFGYQITDIATILSRVRDLHADEIIYLTDKRQSFHFEQVFEVAGKFGIAEGVALRHVGFGTVNGADGKPFKTRDGGVMNLEDFIDLSKEKVRESMPEPSAEYPREYIDNLVDAIAIGAIKFQDLKSAAASGYVFEVDDFAKFDGKTGPYIQYAIARINSILRKMEPLLTSPWKGEEYKVIISNPEERALALKLLQFPAAVSRACRELEPSIIAGYAYDLAQAFSGFYSTSPIAAEDDPALRASRLRLATGARGVMALCLNLLGIKSPEVMLKK